MHGVSTLRIYSILFILILNCGKENTLRIDESPDLRRDVSVEVSANDSSEDLSISTYKDPYRINKEVCEDDFDCARGAYCTKGAFSDCESAATGCGVVGLIFGGEEHGCAILDKNGKGQRTPSDCTEDADCHPDFPHCYMRACQNILPCEMDTECGDGEICYFKLFCTIPVIDCEIDRDCSLGATCVEKLCEYPQPDDG